MSALFHRDPGRWWGIAVSLSILGHAAGAAVMLDLVPAWPKYTPPGGLAEITVTSLVLPDEDASALIAPGQPEAAMEPEQPEAAGDPAGDPEESAEVAPEPQADPDPPEVAPPETPPALPSDQPPDIPDEPGAPNLTPAPEVTENPLLPEPGEAPGGGNSPGETVIASLEAPGMPDLTQPDPGPDFAPPPPPPPPAAADPGPGGGTGTLPAPPRFVPPPPPNAEALRAMVARIRGQIDLSCVIVLPRLSEGDTRLLVVGDNDLSIRAAADHALEDPALDMPMQAVLLDRRQCPAVNFLRARGEYPAFGLSIGLVNTGILSGGRLIGRIDGIPEGAQTALLLVDDNGVVQDLRRFLRFGGGQADFEVPMTRDGDMRDTSQLLIVAVTPGLLNSVTNLGGREAEVFFPALAEEIGQNGALAVIPFDLR